MITSELATIIDAELITEKAIELSEKFNQVTPEVAIDIISKIAVNAIGYLEQKLNSLNENIDSKFQEYLGKRKLTSAQNDDEIIEEWLATNAKNSKNTRRMYNSHTSQFLSWYGEKLENLTVTTINKYEAFLFDQKNGSQAPS